jgi:hypothetical protein
MNKSLTFSKSLPPQLENIFFGLRIKAIILGEMSIIYREVHYVCCFYSVEGKKSTVSIISTNSILSIPFAPEINSKSTGFAP